MKKKISTVVVDQPVWCLCLAGDTQPKPVRCRAWCRHLRRMEAARLCQERRCS
jgi:hypothetical protein